MSSVPGVGRRSRRRLAALAFLSNISLDGTYRDTRISCLHDGRTQPVPCAGPCSDNAVEIDGAPAIVLPPRTSRHTSSRLCSQRSTHSSSVSDVGRGDTSSESPAGRRERRKTVSGEATTESGAWRRRVRHCSASGGDVIVHEGTSSESVGGSVRSHKLASSASEGSSVAVRLLRCWNRNRSCPGAGRLMLLSRCRLPLITMSVLPLARSSRTARRDRYDRGDLPSRRRINSAGRPSLSTIADRAEPFPMLGMDSLLRDGQEVSYSAYLQPHSQLPSCPAGEPPPRLKRLRSDDLELDAPQQLPRAAYSRCSSYDPAGSAAAAMCGAARIAAVWLPEKPGLPEEVPTYHPLLLDNPETRSENHRTLLIFKAFRSSIIEHMKPSDLKRVTNDQFREQFPHVQLTLSKLRSLKREMCRISDECEVDPLTVAQSYVYLEKLVLNGHISKANRKLVSGACLLLSAKMNDVKGDMMTQLIERIESVFRIHRRDLLCCEFGSLVALEFALHLPETEVEPHLRRLHTRL